MGLEPHKIQGYGWKPDLPDHRDMLLAPVVDGTPLPSLVDLEPVMPPVYDQGSLGSCTANAIAAAVDCERIKQGLPILNPSRLFIYYEERKIEGTISEDAGAMIRDGMKVVATIGAPSESLWQYDVAQFAAQPPQAAYDAAKTDLVTQYLSVAQDLDQMKRCLAAGYPFVLGFSVYAGFESNDVARTGDANLPTSAEAFLGGHAVLAVGYSDELQRWKLRNSWATKWGKRGYFTLPYEYLTDAGLASDFWTVRLVATS